MRSLRPLVCVAAIACCSGANAASFDYRQSSRAVVTVFCDKSNSYGGGVVLSRLTIISMEHVVRPCTQVLIGYYNGTTSPGKVVSVDYDRDLVHITPDTTPDLITTAVIETNLPRLGERLHFVSHPNGLAWSYAEGHMAYPDERTITIKERRFGVLQVNVAIFNGSSGGALFNDDGQVVGLGEGGVGTTPIAFFIPASAVCKQLLKCKVGG